MPANDNMMPRWATVGREVAVINHNRGAGLGSSYSEGRRGKITRVLKTQVEVELPYYDKGETKMRLEKFRLKRGYKPFGEGNVRVDVLEEAANKWSPSTLAPLDGRLVARIRVDKEKLINSAKVQGVALAFSKGSHYHVQMTDMVQLLEDIKLLVEERAKIEERILEVDAMPQDR